MAELSKRDKLILLGPNYVDPPEAPRKPWSGVTMAAAVAVVAVAGLAGGYEFYAHPALTTASHSTQSGAAG